MRIEWSLDGFDLCREVFLKRFTPIAREFNMHCRLEYSTENSNVAIFVSLYLHRLVDLLHPHQIGELRCHIAIIIHPDAEIQAKFHGIPFHRPYINATNKVDGDGALASATPYFVLCE